MNESLLLQAKQRVLNFMIKEAQVSTKRKYYYDLASLKITEDINEEEFDKDINYIPKFTLDVKAEDLQGLK